MWKYQPENFPFNYVAPQYFDWNQDGRKDLIFGDGTYASNNIYICLNEGTTSSPKFPPPSVLIKGLGKQNLTPWIVDWNADGKPDILAGERAGNLTLYLNISPEVKTPQFAEEQLITLGSLTKGSAYIAPSTPDLNGDGLFDILFADNKGKIFLAPNTGSKSAPKFATPVPLKAQPAVPADGPLQLLNQTQWGLEHMALNRYLRLSVVTTDPAAPVGFEQGLIAPPESKNKNSLKLSLVKPPNLVYDGKLLIPENITDELRGNLLTNEISLRGIDIQVNKEYILTFYYQNSNNDKITLSAEFNQGGIYEGEKYSLGSSSSWTKFSEVLQFKPKEKTDSDKANLRLKFLTVGNGPIYFDEFSLVEKD
jgi:hypothetical protein